MAPLMRGDREYTPLTMDHLVRAQSTDLQCLEIRKEKNINGASRYTETAEGPLVRVLPLDKAVHAAGLQL